MDVRRRMLFKKKASSGGGTTTGGSYTVDINGQWELTSEVPNPDSTLYDGVYRSTSNYNVNSEAAIMYITINNCSSFKMYIRSYAEGYYDYIMVSQLDKTIDGSTTYSNTTLVKAHTRGNQQSGSTISNYTLVEFTGITSGEHVITVVYRKDQSQHSGDDRGYVLIEKMQAGGDNEGGDDEGGDIIPEPVININDYLTIEALEDGVGAALVNTSGNNIEYCIDGDGNWKIASANVVTSKIDAGHTMSLRCKNTTIDSGTEGIGTFNITGKCNLKGNCMSMLFGDAGKNNFSLSNKAFCFYNLFKNCTVIQSVSRDFLPATTLGSGCYYNMFYGCTSLTSVPDLPALTLVDYCYRSMFYRCSNVNYIKAMFTTTPGTTYTYNWLNGVASSGTFVKNKDATWTLSGASGVPNGWTIQTV